MKLIFEIYKFLKILIQEEGRKHKSGDCYLYFQRLKISERLFKVLGFKDGKNDPKGLKKLKEDDEKGNGNEVRQSSRIEKVEKKLLGVEKRLEFN